MSTELEQLTAAGGTICLGGRTFLLKQLSLGDYGQIQAWLRQRLPRPFAVVARALEDLAPLQAFDPAGYEEARKQLMLAAMEDAKAGDGVGASPVQVEQAMNSPEGLSFVLWLCVRKLQPEVTCEQVTAWVLSEDLTAIKQKLDEITIFAGGEEDDNGVVPKNPQPAPRPTP